jgi:hypothetical protein
VRDTKALLGVFRGDTPGLWQGSAAYKSYNEDSDAILESASKKIPRYLRGTGSLAQVDVVGTRKY